MWFQIAVMALVGTLIGWFTNYLAVRLIFRPYVPKKIPLMSYELQGLIPKRRRELARVIGRTVEEQLLSIEVLLERLIAGENKQEMLVKIKLKILDVVDDKIPFIVPGGIRMAILRRIGDILDNETEAFIDQMAEEVIHKAAARLDIAAIVEERINGFDLRQLEEMILSIARQELRAIEVLGGVLGFVIGTFQGLFIQFIQ